MPPRIAVSVLLEHRWRLQEVCVTDLHAEREVRASIEGRIDVDKLDPPRIVLEQTAHHELVVAPDEQVPLGCLRVMAAKQRACVPLASRPGLVDDLDGLER